MPSERIRILFFIGTLKRGGAEQQLVELATRLDRSRFEPMICCWRKTGDFVERAEAAGVPVVGLVTDAPDHRRPLRTALPIAWRLYPEIHRFRPHIVHSYLWSSCVIGAVVARLARVPVVVTGRRSLATAKLPGLATPRVWHMALDMAINGLTDLVIANSDEVRRDSIRRERLAPRKIITIPNGVDEARFRLEAGSALSRGDLGLNAGPIVVCVANLMRKKGHDCLLAAAPAVSRAHPSVQFLLVGDGPLRDALRDQVSQAGLARHVVFAGSRSDVPEILVLADVAVLASESEGFSSSIIEAMMAGVPVVATDVGGARQAIVPGETGLLIPPRDPEALAEALVSLLGNADARGRMGEAARRRAHERFGVQRMVDATAEVYEQLLSRTGATGSPARSLGRGTRQPEGARSWRAVLFLLASHAFACQTPRIERSDRLSHG